MNVAQYQHEIGLHRELLHLVHDCPKLSAAGVFAFPVDAGVGIRIDYEVKQGLAQVRAGGVGPQRASCRQCYGASRFLQKVPSCDRCHRRSPHSAIRLLVVPRGRGYSWCHLPGLRCMLPSAFEVCKFRSARGHTASSSSVRRFHRHLSGQRPEKNHSG
jgi:hypothetical protein